MALYHLETNLEKIKELGHLRVDENQRFRSFLKTRQSETDALVHQLHNEIAPKIDCTTCGNCCSTLTPYLTTGDVKKLAQGTELTEGQIIDFYTEADEYGLALRNLPCIFFVDHKCTVYRHRPETCASFPHLDKPDFNSRSQRAIENYAVCPIIFNVLERLKVELNFDL